MRGAGSAARSHARFGPQGIGSTPPTWTIRSGAIETELLDKTKAVAFDDAESRYARFVPALRRMIGERVPKSVPPEAVAALVVRAAGDPKRRPHYRIHNDPIQKVLARIPARWIDVALRRMLMRESG